MKKRFLAWICCGCLCLSGCGTPSFLSKTATKSPFPARTLLVVPTDTTGAQAFVVLRFSDSGELTVSSYPRETVFRSKNGDETTFYACFADGGFAGFSRILSAFSESSIPVDRVLSVDVADADSALYRTLSKTGNNLLFTNSPAFVYTICEIEQGGDNVAISASQLRRLLCRPAEDFARPEDYAVLRSFAAIAVLSAGFSAARKDGSTVFSSLVLAGNSTFSPADQSVFTPLLSPAPTLLFRPVSGEFVGVGTRKRFYLSS